jgi:hypothetical protein
MDKQLLVQHIKDWVRYDDEIRHLKTEIRKRNEAKKAMSEELLRLMKSNEIDEIDLSDGKIVRQVRTTKTPLNKKHLLHCLATYYKNVDKAKEVSDFILESRETKTNESIQKKK